MSSHLMNTYAPLPVSFVRGDGAWLWDEDGTRYLDAISGLGVCALGHAHPVLARVISEQAATLIHTGNLVRIPWQEKLADQLAGITGMDRVFFGNSGAEAIECALKISRALGHERGFDNPGVIVMEGSFHGRTMAALSATGNRKVQAGFEPLVSGFVRVPFGDAAAIEKIAQPRNEITAILVEPILGEGGYIVPPDGFLAGLRELCDRHGILLVFDEVQCGIGRTGKLFVLGRREKAVLDQVALGGRVQLQNPEGAVMVGQDQSLARNEGTRAPPQLADPVDQPQTVGVVDGRRFDFQAGGLEVQRPQFIHGVHAFFGSSSGSDDQDQDHNREYTVRPLEHLHCFLPRSSLRVRKKSRA